MLKNIRDYYAKRLLRQIITMAMASLYSEEFDIDSVVSNLSRNQGDASLLRAYVAIQTATRLTEPLADTDVETAFEVLRASEQRAESADFPNILDTHKQLAEIYWLQKQKDIMRRKLAHKENEYSYEGTIYCLEFQKGPCSKQEKAKYEDLCRQMADLDQQIEDHELKTMKDAGDPNYQEVLDQHEARMLRDEGDALEDEALARELEGIETMLRTKLTSLLNAKT